MGGGVKETGGGGTEGEGMMNVPAVSIVWLKTVPRAMAEGFTGGRSRRDINQQV